MPDEPINNLELECYQELIQFELDELIKQKEAEHEKEMKKLDDEYQKNISVLGAFPANKNIAELKRIDDKFDADVITLNTDLEKKYNKLQENILSKFKKLADKLDGK